MERSLFELLDNRALVLTAHRRQARQIRYRYAAAKQKRHIDAWESPQVHGWDDWLVQLHQDITWSGYADPRGQRKLLTLFQQRILWQNIITASNTLALDDVGGTARTAMSAWTMIQAYRLSDPARSAHPSADIEAFGQWMRRYFSRCRDQSLIDHARLGDSLGPALRAGVLPLPAQVVLVGFDKLTPQQRGLLKLLEGRGSKVEMYRGARIQSRVGRVRFDTDNEEYHAVARWIRAILARTQGGNTVVVVPRLNEHRRRIERIFDEILGPGSSLPGDDSGGRPYNLAVGDTFAHAPLIGAAFAACELTRRVVPFETASSLLRSPFLRGAAIEGSLRARFDVWLREQNIARLPVERLLGLFAQFRQRCAPDLDESVTEALFHRLLAVHGQRPATQRASHWAALFRDLLGAVGWPGDAALDSATFQTAERWRALLDEMSGLDFLTPAMDAAAALDLLRSLAQSVSFQPQTPDLSVQVLLPDQAVGLQFDHLWWCGVHAGALPESAAPNPFIPRAWQLEHGTPGCGAEVQLERAQRLTRGLLQAAGEVVVSAPRVVDEHPVSMSPLLSHVPPVGVDDLQLAAVESYQGTISAAATLEAFHDVAGPALAPLETQQGTAGGSSVFAAQAACAFRAFSELRLGARPLEEPTPGLSARERGSLLHEALEAIWQKIGGSKTLKELYGGEFLEAEVWDLTDRALTAADQRRALPMAPRFRALEHQRLNRRVLRWLDVEVKRAPFDVIRAEKRSRITVGGVTVDLTLDRVDRLEGGGLAVIDYKTGAASVAEWFGERPTQPQLPLYALAQAEPVEAVAFAFVKPGQDGFAGISREPGQLPAVDEWDNSYYGRRIDVAWNDLLDYWRANLARLGEQFASGVARVDPKRGACRFCHLASLCRIGAAAELADDDALPGHEQDD